MKYDFNIKGGQILIEEGYQDKAIEMAQNALKGHGYSIHLDEDYGTFINKHLVMGSAIIISTNNEERYDEPFYHCAFMRCIDYDENTACYIMVSNVFEQKELEKITNILMNI